jgi:membrane-associated phospholipid phosphatase
MKRSIIYVLLLTSLSFPGKAQAPDRIDSLAIPPPEFIYGRPKPFTFIKNVPGDIRDYCRITFRKKNLWKISAMIAGTAVLVAADQAVLDGSQKLGDLLRLSHTSRQTTFLDLSIPLGPKKLDLPLNAPSDLNTAMYFIGDGITHFSIAGGFWIYGIAGKNNRARQTATQLTEAILSTGFATQLLKHITGRESPFVSTAPGGVWRVFPNQFDYARNVPKYDAYPSGHLATAMATVTVISSNYPEYRFIKPLGYSMMLMLSYAMLNNGVHWISDYPLSVALGYTFAKIAVKKGRVPFKNNRDPKKEDETTGFGSLDLVPVFIPGNGPGLGASLKF